MQQNTLGSDNEKNEAENEIGLYMLTSLTSCVCVCLLLSIVSMYRLECFIEGTRSRSGKIKTPPKTGFLSNLVEILTEGRLKQRGDDILLIPIAISYDKVLEGATFVNEMLGAKKQKETLTGLINSFNHVIRLNFGSIDIQFCTPISLRATLPSPTISVPTNSNNNEIIFAAYRSLTSSEQHRYIKSVAHRICYEMNLKLVISPTALVATVLLTHLNRGISISDIESRMNWLREEIVQRGGEVAHIFNTATSAAIVSRALQVLAKLVQQHNSIIYGYRQITSLELSFYRNQLLHFFLAESLVCK